MGASGDRFNRRGGADALAAMDIEQRKTASADDSGQRWSECKGLHADALGSKILKLARRVVVAFEHEAYAKAQAKTDAAHEVHAAA